MKYTKTLSVLFLLSFAFMRCSTGERIVSINSVRPADIYIPPTIQSILIVDRTKMTKKVVNIVESVITGEFPQEDKAAVQQLTQAMRAELASSPRFTIKMATEQLYGNSLTTAFPTPLHWDTIQSLCKQYNVDAVLAVEIFDTDFIITNGTRKKKKTITENGVQKEIEVDEYYANGVNNLTMGLRLYDPQSKQIIDEQLIKETGTWNSAAASKAMALAQLISKSDATMHLSSEIGADYAYRIAPMSVILTRKFRGKSRRSPTLEQGSRYADVANWNEAIEIWKTGLTIDHPKDKGYLSYNIAVAYEVLEELELAKKWAKDSYILYGNNDAKPYLTLLENRIYNEQRANEQLK
jgi:Family of unknown function (DUF6340)